MSDNYQSNTAKCHQQPPSFLPEELVFQILLRLPVRSLLEFKRVCKSWKTLISDPKFAKSHLQNLKMNPSITHQHIFTSLLIYEPSKIAYFPVKPLLENRSERPTTKLVELCMENRFLIIGSCNGLLCLFDMDQGYVKLWNPSIGFESKKSPTLDCYDKWSITYNGFGYDHINDKYKLLVVVGRSGSNYSEKVTQIYTFGGTSWTTIQNFPSSINFVGKFVNGTLNWVIIKSGVSSNQTVILSFDLEKETYKEVLLPEHDVEEATHQQYCGRNYGCGPSYDSHPIQQLALLSIAFPLQLLSMTHVGSATMCYREPFLGMVFSNNMKT
ncbi:F-box/kelch-repeat protein [Trifolium medium]|uniref:F-box/kelch-repeat protein n=1 Tax=Trifolium medium TaxID=97028 RepID=A0A392M8C6_9FABA|nr:F-box/kelch-repeat protein [Trifolium medium]